MLKLYSYYSLLLSIMLLIVTALDYSHTILGERHPMLMLTSAAVYVLFASLFSALADKNTDPTIATGYIFVEISILTTMMYATGGLGTGFSSIIIISVVISNLLTPGLLGYGVSAWTTLAVLYTQIYLAQSFDSQASVTVGFYGFLCFILSWVTQTLARRLRSALEITTKQATRIKRLQDLSQQALKSIDSGVIVCNKHHRLLFINQYAYQWFQIEEGDYLPERLTEIKARGLISHQGTSLLYRKVILEGAAQGDYLLTLDDMAELTTQAQQLKLASLGRLTASIAHEIRNPLSALKQAAQLLQEAEYLQEGEQKLTTIIDQQCNRINKTIEEVLQLSRRKKANMTSLNLLVWFKNFADEFCNLYFHEEFKLEISCADDLYVLFDTNHLRQVVTNLCTNALRHSLKHSKNEAKIILRGALIDDEKTAVIEIIDNGGGIESSQQQHLFEPFFTSEHDGTGLGLYLCRELSETNQARIEYEAIPDGSCFRIMAQAEQ